MLVKVGPRGQITIPKSFRKALELDAGDSIAVVQVGEALQLIPVKETIFDFIGRIPPTEGSADWEDIRAEVQEERAKQLLREDNG